MLAIFSKILGDTSPYDMEVDPVHRTLGPKSNDPAHPRDVLCRIHFYNTKEEILHKAWRQQTIDFDGDQITLLSDLSRNTLRRRAILKPLLDKLKQALLTVGATRYT